MSPGSIDAFLVKCLNIFLVFTFLLKPSQTHINTLKRVTDCLPSLANYLSSLLITHVWIFSFDVRCRLTFVNTVRADFFQRTAFGDITFQQQFLPLLLKNFLQANHFLASILILSKSIIHNFFLFF